ncbi:MAG: hypothetical protein ABJC13_07460 [Acidobacteriota bacterium]
MAFNNVGFGTIAPGTSQRWFYSFGGTDHGAQYCMANPLNPGACLQVNDQTKCKNSDGTITYWVTIRNIGSFTTNFNIQGGGLS